MERLDSLLKQKDEFTERTLEKNIKRIFDFCESDEVVIANIVSTLEDYELIKKYIKEKLSISDEITYDMKEISKIPLRFSDLGKVAYLFDDPKKGEYSSEKDNILLINILNYDSSNNFNAETTKGYTELPLLQNSSSHSFDQFFYEKVKKELSMSRKEEISRSYLVLKHISYDLGPQGCRLVIKDCSLSDFSRQSIILVNPPPELYTYFG